MTGPRPILKAHLDLSSLIHAACLGKLDLFFGPDNETTHARETRETAALAICAVCPVLDDCRRYTSLLRPVDGIWAGTTERQRKGRTRGGRRITNRKAAA